MSANRSLNQFDCSWIQTSANEYLSNPISKTGADLMNLISSNKDSNILELFLQGIKKKLSDIQIPYLYGYNPLIFSVIADDNSKLALMLYYGSNVNRKFEVNLTKKKFYDTPPLLLALWHNFKANIRLLILFGASWENINLKELCRDDRKLYCNMPDDNFIFYNLVIEEIQQLRLLDAAAQELEWKEIYFSLRIEAQAANLQNAFLAYSQIGDTFISYAGCCEGECNKAISKKNLPIFYIRKALIAYEKAFYCIEKYLEKNTLSIAEAIELKKVLEVFNSKVFENCKAITTHVLHHDKMQACDAKFKIIENTLSNIINPPSPSLPAEIENLNSGDLSSTPFESKQVEVESFDNSNCFFKKKEGTGLRQRLIPAKKSLEESGSEEKQMKVRRL